MIVQDIRDQNLTAADKSEWSPVDTIKMCNRTRHFTCPYGGTMGDIIDATPQVSKIMLEDKVREVIRERVSSFTLLVQCW